MLYALSLGVEVGTLWTTEQAMVYNDINVPNAVKFLAKKAFITKTPIISFRAFCTLTVCALPKLQKRLVYHEHLW